MHTDSALRRATCQWRSMVTMLLSGSAAAAALDFCARIGLRAPSVRGESTRGTLATTAYQRGNAASAAFTRTAAPHAPTTRACPRQW